MPKFKEKSGDIEIFTPQEIAHFLTYSRTELVPFLAIGAFAGLRSAEIERLDWSEVHLADRFIEVKAAKAKTASRRIVPMPENLAKWLAPHAEKEGRVVPFDNVNKQISWLVEDTNAGLKAAAEKAGSTSPRPAPHQSDSSPTTLTRRAATLARARGRGIGEAEPLKFKAAVWKKNALRHSFISYRVADIQNVNQVALEAGNSSAIIFQHYRELVRPEEAKKWFGIVPGKPANVTAMPEKDGQAA